MAASATALVAVLVACGGDSESQLVEIRSLQDAGQYDASIAPLRQLLAKDSDNPEANFRLGVALAHTGRPSLAVWPLQKAADSEEYGVTAGMMLATTLYNSGSHEEAIRAATKVIDIDATNITALITRAHASLASGKPDKTLTDAERVLELRPEEIQGVALKASALLDLERPEEAESIYKDMASSAEASGDIDRGARTCMALATFYRSQGDVASARSTFDHCIATFPSHGLLQQWVSDFYIDVGDSDRAITVWRKAVKAKPEDLNLRAKLADLLYGQGKREEALAVLKDAVDLFDTPQAWRLLSNHYRARGDSTAAREALEQAMERTREVSPALQFSLADLYIEEGDYEKAREIASTLEEPSYKHMLDGAILYSVGKPAEALAVFEQGLRLWPNNAGARFLSGRAAEALGDRKRAVAEYREAIRIDQTATNASLYLSKLYYSLGQHKTAVQFAERHIKQRPYQEPTAHVIGARSAMASGDEEKALGFLRALEAIDPENPLLFVERAGIARSKSGPAEALAILEGSGLDMTDPANIDLLRAAASDQLQLGESMKARALVSRATAAHPKDPLLLELEARVKLKTGQVDEARATVEKLVALDDAPAQAFELHGRLLAAGGDLDGARAAYEKAQAADEKNADYVYLVAQLLLRKGEQAAALEQLERALLVDAGHLASANDLAWLLASQDGDLEKALELASRAVRLGRSAETLDTLGYVHLKKGNFEEAVTVLGQALEQRPDSPSIEYRLGKALIQTGDRDRAREMFTKALQGPVFPEAEDARAELSKLAES